MASTSKLLDGVQCWITSSGGCLQRSVLRPMMPNEDSGP